MAKKPAYDFKNLTKSQQDSLSLIESLGIYELRALARVFGDNSPTTLKRDDHISIVMKKIISGEDLRPIPLRQGRPYKELSNIEGILAELSQITGKDYTLKTNQQRSGHMQQKMVTFKQAEQEIVKKKLFPIQVRGIIRENNGGLYLINQDNNTHVLVNKEFEMSLKPYDYITGSAIVMNAEKEYILDQVKTINFKDATSYKDIKNVYVPTVPSKTINLGPTINLGGRYLLKNVRLSDDANKINKIVSKLKQEKIITLALVPNVMYEDLITLNTLGFDNTFLIKYDDNPFTSFEIISNFINHVTRLQEQGNNVAIFIQDIITLANAIDFAFKNNTKALMGHTEMAVDVVKKLVQLAKAGEGEKHTTLFTTLDDSDIFDSMYVTSVYKVSKIVEL